MNFELIIDQATSLFGCGRWVTVGSSAEALAEQLRVRGYAAISKFPQFVGAKIGDEDEIEAVVLLCISDDHPISRAIIEDVCRPRPKNVYIRWLRSGNPADCDHSLSTITNWFFEQDFRIHPLYDRVVRFEDFEQPTEELVFAFQLIPGTAAKDYPVSELLTPRRQLIGEDQLLPIEVRERDVHMDMLRESGRRAEAHAARYHFASTYIRPGDRVIDAGCGLGYGSAILWDASLAAEVHGLDGSRFALKYAGAHYSPYRPQLTFSHADLSNRLKFDDESVDVVVCFEALEHIPSPAAFLDESLRILKPGGRIIVSVPNLWIDQTGKDPWIFHLTTFDQGLLANLLETRFRSDLWAGQTAGGPDNRYGSTRSFRTFQNRQAMNQTALAGAEWILAAAWKDPLAAARSNYQETVLATGRSGFHFSASFAAHYKNPWLAHALVHAGLRMRSGSALHKLAEDVIAQAPNGSVEQGAALCVEAYRTLDRNGPLDDTAGLLAQIDAFLAAAELANPHGLRWHISLSFVRGLLLARTGNLEQAEQEFTQLAGRDALKFTPHLATKTTAAAFLGGMLALSRHDRPAARQAWLRGLDIARQVLAAEWDQLIVDEVRPNRFGLGDGLREIALAFDNATRCANGLYWLSFSSPRPGAFVHVHESFQRATERLNLVGTALRETSSVLGVEQNQSRTQASLIRDLTDQRETLVNSLRESERICQELRIAVATEAQVKADALAAVQAEADLKTKAEAWANEEQRLRLATEQLLHDAEAQRDAMQSAVLELERTCAELRVAIAAEAKVKADALAAVQAEAVLKTKAEAWAQEEQRLRLAAEQLLHDAEAERDAKQSAVLELERTCAELRAAVAAEAKVKTDALAAVQAEAELKAKAEAWAREEQRIRIQLATALEQSEQQRAAAARIERETYSSLSAAISEEGRLKGQAQAWAREEARVHSTTQNLLKQTERQRDDAVASAEAERVLKETVQAQLSEVQFQLSAKTKALEGADIEIDSARIERAILRGALDEYENNRWCRALVRTARFFRQSLRFRQP